MYTLGIDIGSTTSKCVILKDGEEIVAKSIQLGGLGTDGPSAALAELWNASEIKESDIARTTVTGYGRMKFEGGDDEASELTCHALGGRLVYPGLRTVIDIGGQDAKVISLSEDGRMSNFVMNDKCAAGTGRFLDVMANILKMDVNDFGSCAAASTEEIAISSTCTVFAESEVISQLANGVKREDLVAGICTSVAVRVAALARRAGVKELVCMSGGVAKNEAVRRALEKSLDVDIAFDPLAQYFGAIGAARYSYNKLIKQQR
ncbi:MAG: 2-hydroxyglutaryl-CoA dehydratase [Clostridiales bacterium]|nr:2-hydroxyglutaryl-CoA dehydratase [Candidatus Crickella merdequi]